MQQEPCLKVTLPNLADDGLMDGMFLEGNGFWA